MTGKPRRVLMICYYFPPLASVGSVRVGALARYLPRHGWEPTIVTPRHPHRLPSPYPVLETDDADLARRVKRRLGLAPDAALKDQVGAGGAGRSPIRRLGAHAIELAKAVVAFPDANRGWVPLAAAACERALAAGAYDAVLTSSPPVSAHRVGFHVRRNHGVPWVADLRDLWSEDHNSTAPAWRRALDRRLERATFALADQLVTVSAPLAGRLAAMHPTRSVHTILNGFDPELTRSDARPTASFTLTHTGTFYQGRRDPTVLFEALASLFRDQRLDRSRVRVRLYSRRESWLSRLVEHHGLGDVVELRDWVPWEEALAAQRESQVLLLLHWGAEGETGVYTGKVFEYLAARRPILVVGGGRGVLDDLLEETGAGVHVRDRPALEARLLDWWQEYETRGAVAWRGEETRLARYSHVRMAGEFAQVLDAAARSAR